MNDRTVTFKLDSKEISIEMKFSADVDIEENIDNYKSFLLACGYNCRTVEDQFKDIEYDDELDKDWGDTLDKL